MYYVYILNSIDYPEQIYIGFTENLENRLAKHNTAQVTYTRKYAPWQVATYIAFKNKEEAVKFEKYLKSGAGRAFLYKRLI